MKRLYLNSEEQAPILNFQLLLLCFQLFHSLYLIFQDLNIIH